MIKVVVVVVSSSGLEWGETPDISPCGKAAQLVKYFRILWKTLKLAGKMSQLVSYHPNRGKLMADL